MTELARTRPESFFADRFNVTRSLLERVLGSNLIGRADDADIYLEYRVNEELQLEEGTVKRPPATSARGRGSGRCPERAPATRIPATSRSRIWRKRRARRG